MTIGEERFQSDFPAPTAVAAEYLRRSISVSHLLGLMWSGRLLLITATVLGLLFGIYSVYTAGPSYMAVMHVAPAETDGGVGQLNGATGLLASLTGGGGTIAVPKFTQFIVSLGSVEVAKRLDKKYDALCRIYHGDCDQITHQWRERTGIREWFNGLLARLGHLPDPNGPRTLVDLAAYLAAAVNVKTNKENSIVELSYIYNKQDFAASFLSEVVNTTNNYIREQNQEIQKHYVDYLTQSAAKATNVEQRQAIDALLLQEERQLMMTEVDIPYAAKIIDGPTVTPVNKVLKTLAVNTFIGLVLGLLIVSCRDFFPRRWRFW